LFNEKTIKNETPISIGEALMMMRLIIVKILKETIRNEYIKHSCEFSDFYSKFTYRTLRFGTKEIRKISTVSAIIYLIT
jgi:hypothetical protein